MSSPRFFLCLLLSTIAQSVVFANAIRQKRDEGLYKPIFGAVAGPVDDVIGTVGGVYGQFPALAWLETLLSKISFEDILEANGETIDDIMTPILGTVIKPKGTGAPAATTAPSA
ncbi:hypothetical protein PMAYCL1PPCAC_04738 [Pristionchus mayeri]|uniref:Uncharacterized protein n=1 Tax=Pristionchus mayeri TaxID=1317129 RepID=A0AAN4Z9R4_9BILA|nr:hypothetical protein PMAYCL1PPCAC_04738 [Pristionchus mayeri]